MPFYDYKCKSCGHQFEKLQSINSEKLKSCPVCGKGIDRLIPKNIGFILSGDGFYATDHGHGNNGIIGIKKKGEILMNDRFPEQGKILDKLHKRRRNGNAIDGTCFKEAGKELERLRAERTGLKPV